jgi:hypothetical protein
LSIDREEVRTLVVFIGRVPQTRARLIQLNISPEDKHEEVVPDTHFGRRRSHGGLR